jgi:hypothetical protein
VVSFEDSTQQNHIVFLSTHNKSSTLPNRALCSCKTGLYKIRNEQFYVKHTSFYWHRSVKLSIPPTDLAREAASTCACSRFAIVDSSQSEMLHNKHSNHNNITVPRALASTTLMCHPVYRHTHSQGKWQEYQITWSFKILIMNNSFSF